MAPLATTLDWLSAVACRLSSFLREELGIETSDAFSVVHNSRTIELKFLTTLMSVEGRAHVYLGFSFDEPLIRQVMDAFTQDLEIPDNEVEAYLQESASEMINIVIGNASACFENRGDAVSLSPPLVVTEATRLLRHKDATFYSSELVTEYGTMAVFCIGPKDLIEDQFASISL